jgi:hypothetical protein
MSVTRSLADEEKRSIEFDKHSTGHLGSAQVSYFFYFLFPSPLGCKVEAPDPFLENSQHDGIAIDEYDDPNFDPTAFALEDESPYPEVRSAVANTDDPYMPSSTLRAWVVGLIWAIVIPGVNQFFFFRYPSITISQVRGFYYSAAF